jgi:hypothetical protein
MGLEVLLYRVRALYPRCLGKHTIIAESQKYVNGHVVAYDIVWFKHAGAY